MDNCVVPVVAPEGQKRDEDGRPQASTDGFVSNPELAETDFAAAILIIARLPLNDTEKADAVRRLLAAKDR